MSPDQELRPSISKRSLEAHGDTLICKYECNSDKTLRLVAGSFLENIDVVIRTMEEFAD